MNLNLLLICSLGMSSSILEMKIREEAEKRGYDCKVHAISVQETSEYAGEQYDAVLIAPQIVYLTKEIQKDIHQDTVLVNMAVTDYGMIKADNILDATIQAIEEHKR